MGDDYRVCRRTWEENIYWSHFQSVQFFQTLSGRRYDQQLAIPQKFSTNLRDKLTGAVSLRGPSGVVWNVGVTTMGDNLFFENGWKEFVKDHSLEENDTLMFKYNGNLRFDVLIFDNQSQCEKETSYFVKGCGHAEVNSGCKRKGNLAESFEVTNESLHDDVKCVPTKRPRNNDTSPPQKPTNNVTYPPKKLINSDVSLLKKSTTINEASTSRAMRRNRRSCANIRRRSKSESTRGPAYTMELSSNRRPVTVAEIEKALQLARAASSKDSFIMVMKPSNVYKGFYMSVPSEWAKIHLPKRIRNLTLRVKESTWQVKYLPRKYGGGLVGGWRNFVYENFLEEFDVCLFKIVSKTTDALVLDVSIFRVVEDVVPASRVTLVYSRGKKLAKNLSDGPNKGIDALASEQEF